MGDLLERARAVLTRRREAVSTPTRSLRLSEFASSGRVVRVRSEVVGAEIYFAADNADITAVSPDAVIFWPDELADIHEAGPECLQLLWQTKTAFDPHGRTEAEV